MKLLLAIAVVGACKQDAKPAAAPPPPTPVVAADAAVVADAATPDAEAPEPPSIVDTESIGGLAVMADEATVIGKLGKPRSKTKPIQEGATMSYVSDWDWPTASLTMVADEAKGPYKARMIGISKASTLETKAHIHIGSTRKELEAAYKRSEDDDGSKPDSYLVGSMYGGLLFGLTHDKVTSIAIGPFAF